MAPRLVRDKHWTNAVEFKTYEEQRRVESKGKEHARGQENRRGKYRRLVTKEINCLASSSVPKSVHHDFPHDLIGLALNLGAQCRMNSFWVNKRCPLGVIIPFISVLADQKI